MAELRHLVRLANADLDGKKNLVFAMKKVKGVSIMFANMVCKLAGIDTKTKVGTLTDAQIEKLNDVIRNPEKYKAPSWMLNRRKDNDTGKDRHIVSGDLQFIKSNDIKMMKKIKCYRGVRHMLGLPCRGQRTRSNFRPNKGKVLGVRRSSKQKGGGRT